MAGLAGAAAELEALAFRLRRAGDTDLLREVTKAMRDAVEPVQDQIRAGLVPHLPNPYAAALDEDLRLGVNVRTTDRDPGVAVTGRPWDWLWVVIGATAMIDAGLWWAQPQVQWYVGLSGLLHGAWAAGAAAEGVRRGGWAWLMPVVLVLKLALEQRAGASLLAPEFPVVTIAHLYGALGGLGAYAALALARKPL
jgi:hypothetical protein